MTNEEAKNKAEEIVNKYSLIVPSRMKAILCAIEEVKAIIAISPSLPIQGEKGYLYEDIELSTKYYQQILSELEKM